MKKYIAELIGTFGLTFVVILSVASTGFPLETPLLAALTLAYFVYAIGPISGSHINPAVTAGLLAIGKVDLKDALVYVVAQFLGAAAAVSLANAMGLQLPAVASSVDSIVMVAEAFGAFFFTFGIAAVAHGKVSDTISGIMVGGSLLLGIAVAALVGSGGILNPAVALGLGTLTLPYAMGPILGSVFGMVIYKLLDSGAEPAKKERK